MQYISGFKCTAKSKRESFAARKDQRLVVDPITSVTFTGQGRGSKIRCLVWCKKISGCRSVNHQWNATTSSVTCEALNVYLHEVVGGTTWESGWSFIQQGTYVENYSQKLF
jgi:hypothetical protein